MKARTLRHGPALLASMLVVLPACAESEEDLDDLGFRHFEPGENPREPLTRVYLPPDPAADDGGGGDAGGGDGDGGGGDAGDGGGDGGGPGGDGGDKGDDGDLPGDEIGPDDLIWIFENGGLYSKDGEDIFHVIDGVFYDADGVPRCVIEGNELSTYTRIRSLADGGEVIFTVRGPFVFDGELNLKGKKPWQKWKILHDKLLFTFHGRKMYAGFPHHGDLLIVADHNLVMQTRKRKFEFASAVAGECGGPGLPDPDDLP